MDRETRESIANAAGAPKLHARAEVGPAQAGQRLDRVAAEMFHEHSRERLKQWIRSGELTVNGQVAARPRDPVALGDALELRAEPPPQAVVAAQPIELDLVHEDAEVLVLNKPAGLTVHPGAGQADGTLQNALLHRYPELAGVPRAGIVHRIDKQTTGLLVVARSLSAHTALVRAIQAREVHREYHAVVHGVLTGGATVDAPIGRHPAHRTRMAVREGGKPARTHYRVLERFAHHSLIAARLESGRTHQIRVHMQHQRYPLVGDPVYGQRGVRGAGMDPALRETIQRFARQALHACRLEFEHPASGQPLAFEQPWPADFAALVEALRNGAPGA